MRLNARLRGFRARPDRHLLLLVAHYWGKGATIEDAYQKLKEAGGTWRADEPWIVYDCDPNTHIDDMGNLTWPQKAERPNVIFTTADDD